MKEDNISRVSDYRSKREPNGNMIRKFVLVTDEANGLPARINGNLIYHADYPVILDLNLADTVVHIHRQDTTQEETTSEMTRQIKQKLKGRTFL